MGQGITKRFKRNDFDGSPIVDPKPVDVTQLEEKSKSVDQMKMSIHSISENIPHKPVVRTESHHKHQELPPLKKAPKFLRKFGRTPKHDSEHSPQQVSDCQLSPTEKQSMTKPYIQFEYKMRQVPDGEASPSQKETQFMETSETSSRTVYQTSAATTNIEGQQNDITRSQQSLIPMHVQTTSLTDSDQGSTIPGVEKTIHVDETVADLNRTQTKKIEIHEQYFEDAQRHGKTKKESKNVQKPVDLESSIPKVIYDPCFDVCTYLINLKQSQEDPGPFMIWFCSLAKNSIQLADNIWLGYELEMPNKPVIVAIYKDIIPELPKHFNNLDIIKRQENEVSGEGMGIARAEQTRDLKFSSKEQQRVQQCLTKFSASLMKSHSNLNIVSASKIKCKYYGTKKVKNRDQTCITLYVHIKGVIPFFEELFPKELEKVPVDVREGTFHTFGKLPDEYHSNLMMGCQIVSAYNKAGTLGGFVKLQNGNIGCLTCCHLFKTTESMQDYQKDPLGLSYFKKDVFQPNPTAYCKFGSVALFAKVEGDHETIGVDMALIEITDRKRCPTTGGFPDAELPAAGFSPENPMVYTSGEIVKGFDEIPQMPCPVVKYGIGTGPTVGMLRLHGSAVCKHSTDFLPNDYIRLHQQFEVFSINIREGGSKEAQPFAKEGDSGALVFLISKDKKEIKLKALGLLVGGTDNGTTIVTPIWAILEHLNLPLNMLSFDGSLMETDLSRGENDRLQRIEKDVDDLKAGVSTLYSRLEETTQTTQRTEQNIVFMDRKIEEIRTSVANKQDIETILQVLSKK